MQYYPEKRDEILAKRKLRKNKKQKNNDKISKSITPLDIRLEKLKNMKENQQKPRSRSDEFLDSVENQKKYGFRTEIVDGIRHIYYDGDLDVLEEAMYGPVTKTIEPSIDPERILRLSIIDERLLVVLPDKTEGVPVSIRVGTCNSSEPHFGLVTDDGTVLVQFGLTQPLYYPEETAGDYLLDMNGMTVINQYVYNNIDPMIDDWNRLNPNNQIGYLSQIPNYRYLGSVTYLMSRRKN